jgi:hypothetical protein
MVGVVMEEGIVDLTGTDRRTALMPNGRNNCMGLWIESWRLSIDGKIRLGLDNIFHDLSTIENYHVAECSWHVFSSWNYVSNSAYILWSIFSLENAFLLGLKGHSCCTNYLTYIPKVFIRISEMSYDRFSVVFGMCSVQISEFRLNQYLTLLLYKLCLYVTCRSQ